ncbi:MAG: preprotein translocase subunit YajC [Candidatus Omnitrophica bacterium]|nr:preprotein translocase subunit YajC [Candidatus Omnitrophota bacterium]
MYLFLAQAAQRPPALVSFMPIILIFGVFYFLIIKPQRQKQAEHQKMIQAVKKNDEIITIGGIHGTIINVKEGSITLRISDNVKIEIQKSAVAGLKKSKPEVSGETIEVKS